MRKAIHRLTFLLALTLLLNPSTVTAQTQVELPDAGVTPDNWLYGLDKAIESIQMILTFNEASKAELHLQFAGERLAEAKAIADKGKPEYVPDLVGEYEGNVGKSLELVATAKQAGKNMTKVLELVAIATSIHLVVLEEVYEKVPEVAKPAIERAMQKSTERQAEALDEEELPPEQAQEAKEKAEKARAKAEEKRIMRRP